MTIYKLTSTILILLFRCLTYGGAQEVLISENFENGLPDSWSVETNNNKRSWNHKVYKDQNYVQMSAYGGKGNPGFNVKTKLHSPLIQTNNKTCKLRFEFADAFQNGQPLQVMISDAKHKPLRAFSDKNWSGLVNNSGSYDNQYEATEWINIPNVSEPFHISFVYNSNQDEKIVTTLIQLNEVDVWCE